MSEFLTTYVEAHRNPSANELRKYRERFEASVNTAHEAIGDAAFRPERNFNAAVFDSVMIGVARRLDRGAVTSKGIAAAYKSIMSDANYVEMVSRSTADSAFVTGRISVAIAAFGKAR
jgi:hypothetical protein